MATIPLPQHKKKARCEGADILFEDEASFRQDSTLHQTWSIRGHQPLIPVTGARKSVKVFATINLQKAKFLYRREPVFNAETYLGFLEQMAQSCRRSRTHRIHMIQDNASYHKDKNVWAWFRKNRSWLEVHQLPAYSPEFNATERLWHHARITGTHNRYFASEGELLETLTSVFEGMQKKPDLIKGYLRPFL